MSEYEELVEITAKLRKGCPWDREQTHMSLKAPCIEEAAEVICGINIYNETGNADNLKEELGDLLFQVLLNAAIAEEEGIFTLEDVCRGVKEKMIRRHPHIFGRASAGNAEEAYANWNEVKRQEKTGKEWTEGYLPGAFEEAKELIDVAKKRKGYK